MHKSLQYSVHLIVLCILLSWNAVTAQVYVHNFGTTAISAYPYTTAPTTLHPDLSASSWTNSTGSWTSYAGATGEALGMANSSGAASLTLRFTVAAGKELNISSFSFWRQRSNAGAQNWSMTINGIAVGNGAVPTTGTTTGLTTVTNPVTGLTGNVQVVIALSGASGNGTFRLDDFTLNGAITSSCTAPVATAVLPASGPANTTVTITGSGFLAGTGTTAVKFNGVDATAFTVLSDTSIKATVPAAATTGPITITTNQCSGVSPSFTVLSSNCGTTSAPSDLYISELYDHVPGSYGVIEIYNPTPNTIVFNGNYVLERYGDVGDATPSNTLTLTGSIGSEMTYLVLSYGTGVMGCNVVTNALMGTGINENDEIKLVKNNIVLDISRAPNAPGYTVIRKPSAIAPTTAYNSTDWTFGPQNCADLGNHNALPVVPSTVITTQPLNKSVCENGQTTFGIAVSNPTGFTYQWKVLTPAGTWTNVANGPNYSGATTATLTVTAIPANLSTNQYYCEISSAACTLISNAAELLVTPAPTVPTLTTVQPTCTTTTGSITVTAPITTGLTYSIDGTNFQNGTTFANLAPGTYTITVKNTNGCTTAAAAVTINPAPGAPAVPTTTLIQPTCSTPTGTITITAPIATGLTYSIDGANFQSGTVFTALAPGSYTITVKNTAGCTAVAAPVTINTVPAAPNAPTVTIVQPTCIIATGTITVTAPLAADLTYSIDGVTFQSGTVFATLAPGTYTITVKNAAGCTAVATPMTINAAPGAPTVPTAATVQPTCSIATGTITVTAPLAADLTYSIDGVTFQSGSTFTNLTSGIYTITVKNAAGCTAMSAPLTITTVPGAPVVPTLTSTQPTCSIATGTITVTAPLAADLTYSIDGITFQSGTTFTNLAPGNYTVTVKNAAGCTAVSAPLTLNPVPGAPAAPTLTSTQPTCSTATGIITVTAPVTAGLTYSIDGTNFQSGTTFANLAPGTYTITVKNTAGCTAVSAPATINVAPGAPAVPTVTTTQPSCSNPMGTISITTPSGTGFTYSMDGINFQPGATFSNLSAGTYTITVKNAAGCTATSAPFTITAANSTPLATTIQECRDTAFGKQYILEVFAVGATFETASTTFTWRNSQGAIVGNNQSTFNVTEYVASHNIQLADFPLLFSVTLTTTGGCQDVVPFTVDHYFCSIPKGISPNNDGQNDNFDLTGMNVKKLKIYNRYGLEVYSKNNYSNEWHGQSTHGDELPTGTYYYAIELNDRSQTGWVYINR